MNTQDEQLFNQAVAMAQAGNNAAAYDTLSALRFSYPQEIKVLLWCAYSAPDLRIAKAAIDEAARLQPGSQEVTQAQGWLAMKEMQGGGNQPQPPARVQPQANNWPAPGATPAATPLPNQYQAASARATTAYNTGGKTAKKKGSSGCLIAAIITVVVFGIMIAAIIILPPIFAKNDAQTLLDQFMRSASTGDYTSAYNQVLPDITQDELKTSFFDPNAARLRDYSNLVITDSEYRTVEGGSLTHVKGTVNFKTQGKSTFEADIQRVDDDERSYIVTFQMGPPSK